MRYPPGHKERTRRKIVTAASRTFRREGMGKAAVAKVMRRAGLTHGGFYAHFRGKDALAAEVFAEGFQALERLREVVEEWKRTGREHPLIRVYLSAWHRDHPDEGCLLAPLTGDLAREPKNVRRAFSRAFERYVGELGRMAFGQDVAPDDPRTLALVAGMIGAMSLARAVDDPRLSDRILRDCRRAFIAAFTTDQPKAPKS
jgi:TetR/AcrR family transcriptional regulator, transcriptional repressor for nem operon